MDTEQSDLSTVSDTLLRDTVAQFEEFRADKDNEIKRVLAAADQERAALQAQLELVREQLATVSTHVQTAALPQVGVMAPLAPPPPTAQQGMQELHNEYRRAFQKVSSKVYIDDLPTLATPTGTDLEAQGRVHCLLSRWTTAGADAPFTFGDLNSAAKLGGLQVAFVAALLGQKVWDEWFDANTANESILPRQAANMLYHALDKTRKAWEAEVAVHESIRQEAATAYGILIDDTSKRYRAVAQDAPMPQNDAAVVVF